MNSKPVVNTFESLFKRNGELELENLRLQDEIDRYRNRLVEAEDAWATLNRVLS